MSDIALYHDGSRELQDRFQTRRRRPLTPEENA
jgi:hypothetical protein